MATSMRRAELLPIAGLTLAAFALNTSEFMPIGLLTDIADSFAISEATCGLMISVYAWTVTVASLPLMLLACRAHPRNLLLGVIALFGLGQLGSALAPTFVLLVAARLLVACAHAIFWSIAVPFAVRVADDAHASQAMSMIVTGTSVAMIFGLPLGRTVGLVVGWRMTFAIMAVIAAALVAYLVAVFPRIETGEPFTLAQLPSLLRNRTLLGIYLLVILVATGYYTGYSYIEPFLAQVGGFSDALVTGMLMVFGAAGLAGSWLFSRVYDRRRTAFLTVSTAGIPLALLLLAPGSASVVATFALCAVWGASATAFNVAGQAEIVRATSTEASTVAMSIFSGIFNLGIGLGSLVGGTVVDGPGIALVGLVGGVVGALGALWCGLGLSRLLRRR